jgi:hypothetical protein
MSLSVFILFPGATDLCASYNWMQTSAGVSVCLDDFVLVRLSEWRLFETLLWHLNGSGLCCAVSGPFVAHMENRFTRFEMLGLNISTPTDHDSEASRVPNLYSGAYHTFYLGGLACEMLPQ